MKSLKLQHFYYGAILTAIMEYNPDASMVLVQPQNDSRKAYKITTNSSKECFIIFKYANERTQGSRSCVYAVSDEEKFVLKQHYDAKIPTFLYLLCANKKLKDSEIAILNYDEFILVSDKTNFTIGSKKNFPNFYLHRDKHKDNDLLIPRNRIEKTFDELIDDIVKASNGYYCPNCGTHILV